MKHTKKLTKVISSLNSFDEINFSFLKRDLASKIGTFLFNKLDGSSDGFLSIIKR